MMQTRLPLARRARSATSTTITTSLLSQVILIVSGVFAARLLGVEDRGRLALLVLVPAALAQVGALGLPVAVTYYVARDPKSSPAIVQRVVPVAIAQAAVLVAVQAAILAVLVQSSHVGWTPALLSLLVVPASLVQQYGLAVHQGSQSFSTFNGLRVLPASLYAVGLTALEIAGGAGLIGVASVWVAGTSLAAILTAAATVRMLPARRPDGPSVGEMARFGRRAFIDATSPVEAFRIDQAVAGLLLSPAALGLYVVALAFTNLPRFIGQSIGMVAYPRIAGAKNQSGGQIWKYVALVAVVAGAAVVVMEAAMPRLVPLFFGAEFAAAVPLARIVLVAGFLVAIRRVLADGLRGTGRPALGTIGEIVSWVVLFPALAVFTPLWGVNGVAAALAVAAAGSLTVLGGSPS